MNPPPKRAQQHAFLLLPRFSLLAAMRHALHEAPALEALFVVSDTSLHDHAPQAARHLALRERAAAGSTLGGIGIGIGTGAALVRGRAT